MYNIIYVALQGVGFKQRTAFNISEYSSILPRRQYVIYTFKQS
jgi:pyruvoyl-dependent arginine decarboxylase (PvlArgDC)